MTTTISHPAESSFAEIRGILLHTHPVCRSPGMYTREIDDLRKAFSIGLDPADPDDAEARADLIERIMSLGEDPWAYDDVEPDPDDLTDDEMVDDE